MLLNRYKNSSVQVVLAEAYALKKRGFYAAAKHLIKSQLQRYPQHKALQALYQRIGMLQQIKVNRRHSVN